MSYTIIGNDGKSYGPIGADQIRQWIKQSRVESRTPVFVQGATDWTFVGLLPEFAVEFPENPPVIAPKPGAPAAPTRSSALATWGFVCGLLSWTFCGCCVPFAILGLTFSILALVQINSHPEGLTGRGLAIAGLVLSATNLAWSLCFTLMGLLNNSPQLQLHLNNLIN